MRERITGYVGELIETFWVEGNVVKQPLVMLPIGYGDQVEHVNGTLTRLVRRSPRITVGMLVLPEEDTDFTAELPDIQQVVAETGTELHRIGAKVEMSTGILLAARTDLTPHMVATLGKATATKIGIDPDRVRTHLLTAPSDPVDLDIRPKPATTVTNPLPPRLVAGWLSRPELEERHMWLVSMGEIPPPLDFHRILHASVNEAAIDPALRNAWVDGDLDAVLVLGARLLGNEEYSFPSYLEGLYNHFTYRASNWL